MTKENRIIFDEMGENEIADLARKISVALSGGDILLLKGEIGTGKTFFARSLIQERILSGGEAIEEIPSPTFTIVQLYNHIIPPIWHVDLYRVDCSDEIDDLGLDEAYYSDIVLIEWPEKLGVHMPKRFLSISFEHEKTVHNLRKITFETKGPNWGVVLNFLDSAGTKRF